MRRRSAAALIGGSLAGLTGWDLLQRRHTILRNYPIIGHLRFLLEAVGPELRQYIVTDNDAERPFSRDQRRWVYTSAKSADRYFGFGTDNDLERVHNYPIVKHAAFPVPTPDDEPNHPDPAVPLPAAKVLGGARGRVKAFRPSSLVNVSGMSFGSLSAAAVTALNKGAAMASALHTTGEGGVSPYHLNGGDLVWQIGTGYFGCRNEDGTFSLSRLIDRVAAGPSIRAVEIKLSQGAKPGLGGMLPGAKVTPEIAAIRGVPVGVDCKSPAGHSAFRDVDGLLELVETIAAETGLPVGIKSAVGEESFWLDLAERMARTGRGVDFVTVDGGEGAAAVVSLAAAYVFLARRGVWRWLALAVFVLAPVAVIVVYAFRHLLWVAIVSAAFWLLASITARQALTGDQTDWRMPEYPAQPPTRRPYLIMNPKSGGGKVGKFDLKRKAEALGAEVFLLGGSEHVDVAAVARKAVAEGADLLGVAGGDGTQALVAGIAAEHGLPFVVISAGTRNHFALDLGLDREDPSACLGALSDGVELRVDLGMINGQTFVNNASFGAYAEVVETPAYRGDKLNTTLNTLPDLLQGHRGARLHVRADGTQIEAPQALLVANNPYGTGDLAGLGRRARLDRGILGVVGVKVDSARQAAGLLRGRHAAGLRVLTAGQIEVTADEQQIPVGVDGESILMSTPVTCTISAGALRVWVPRDRPGIPRPKSSVNWARLRHLAGPARRQDHPIQAPR